MGIETFRYLSRGARCHSSRDVMAGAKKNSRTIRSLYPSTPLSTAALYPPWKSVNEPGQIGVVSRRSFRIASTLIGKVSGCPARTWDGTFFLLLSHHENRGFMFDGADPVGTRVRSQSSPLTGKFATRSAGPASAHVRARCTFIAKHDGIYERRRKICISKSQPIGPRVAAHSTDAPMTAMTSPFCIVTCVYAAPIFPILGRESQAIADNC